MAASYIVNSIYNDIVSAGSGGSDGDGNITSIDIDNTCEMTIIIGWGLYGSGALFFDQIYWNSNSSGIQTGWTRINPGNIGVGASNSIDAYYMLESHASHPSTGATNQDIYFSFNSDNVWQNGGAACFQIADIAASGYIVDEDDDNYGSQSGWTGSLSGLDSEDLTVIAANVYNQDVEAGGGSQTEIYDYNSAYYFAIGVEVNESSPAVTFATASDWACIAFAINGASAAAVTLEQEGFRWRNDDDSEASATWIENQDVDASIAKETNIRLRVLVNATNDPDNTQYELQYKRTDDGAGEYRAIPES